MTALIDDTATPIALDTHSTAGEAVTAYLREQAGRMRSGEAAVRAAERPGVHDMRVATRRLRSALRTFRKVYRDDQRSRARALGGELKWLSELLGAARDAEVIGRQLAAEVAATPVELVLGPVPAELDRYLAKKAATTRADLISALDGRRYAQLADALDMFLIEAPTKGKAGKPAADVLPPMVAKAYRRARTAARTARGETGSAREDALHRVRKAVKRLRYATEVATPVVGGPAQRYGRRCKKVQRVLGDHHDYVVLRGTLRELGIQTHLDGGNAFTFGLLHGRIGMATIQREHDFARLWRKLAARKARRWLHG